MKIFLNSREKGFTVFNHFSENLLCLPTYYISTTYQFNSSVRKNSASSNRFFRAKWEKKIEILSSTTYRSDELHIEKCFIMFEFA